MPSGTSAGVTKFIKLKDAPYSYSGQSGKVVKVKTTEDGLQFGIAGVTKFTELSDVPSSYTGQAGNLPYVKTTEDGLEFLPQKAVGFNSRVHAYLLNFQNIPSIEWCLVRLNGREFDDLNEFDILTHRFIPSVAGYYLVIGQVVQDSDARDQQHLIVEIRKNGIGIAFSLVTASGTQRSLTANVARVVYLTPLDYLELWVTQNSGVNVNLDNGFDRTYLSIHRLS